MSKPYALIQPQASIYDTSGTFKGLETGMIMLIYQTSDRFIGGESVLYNPIGKTSVVLGGVEYFLVKEEDIINQEQAAP